MTRGFGRYIFKIEKTKATHKCGNCSRLLKVGSKRLVIKGGNAFESKLCGHCAATLSAFVGGIL